MRQLRIDLQMTRAPNVGEGQFVGRLARTMHAYPTESMAIQQSALQFFGDSSGLKARPVSAS